MAERWITRLEQYLIKRGRCGVQNLIMLSAADTTFERITRVASVA